MRFAKFTFLFAALYGILAVAPEYALESRYGTYFPPPINHPEFFYGFIGVCLTFQLLSLLIASDPTRFRPIMPLAILEKLSFTLPALILHLQGRLNPLVTFFSLTDLLWATLFLLAYLRTPRSP